MEQYKGVRLGELSPHVFAVADASYRWDLWAPEMFSTKLNHELLLWLIYG